MGQREGTHLSKNIHTEQMKQRIDSAEGRAKYGRRFATAEPVFVNLRHNKQLNRLRAAQPSQGGRAVEALRLVHNIEKLAHHGYAQKGKPGD